MPIKLNTHQFIEKANCVHGTRYDYSYVEYVNAHKKVKIKCSNHGIFLQRPNDHLSGYGCKNCANDNNKLTKEEFVNKSNQVHDNKYSYDKFTYTRHTAKGVITCFAHGDFLQTPKQHISATQGCPVCGGKLLSNALDFSIKANIKHNNKYDYANVNYVNAHTKVDILCSKHGVFQQTPGEHTKGYGCKKCAFLISQPEKSWLDYLNVPDAVHTRQVRIKIGNTTIVVDGFCDETNTIYEFWGDYWHGNPKRFPPNNINTTTHTTFKDLYEKTQQKRQIINDAGYTLVEIWESEWDEIVTSLD